MICKGVRIRVVLLGEKMAGKLGQGGEEVVGKSAPRVGRVGRLGLRVSRVRRTVVKEEADILMVGGDEGDRHRRD